MRLNRLKNIFLLNLFFLSFGSSPVAAAEYDLTREYAYGGIGSFGQIISYYVPIAFSIAGIMVVIYFLVGVFEFIISFGDKNAVAAAKDKILHAVIGLILLLIAFVIFRVLPSLLKLEGFNIIGIGR